MAFRLSLELSHICPVKDLPKQISTIESKGFYRVWVPDTIVSPWEAWMAAGLIAHQTRQVQIGLGVTNPYTRHPLVTAQMAATLQEISRSRLALSLGKGIGRLMEKAGIDQHDSAVTECTRILKKLTMGERVTCKGKAFTLDRVKLGTKPPEKTIPIYHAAMGPDSWKEAIQIADGIVTIWNDSSKSLLKQAMETRKCPSAAMVPFSLTRKDFFPYRVSTMNGLETVLQDMKTAGFDEAVIAYAQTEDLLAAANFL